MKALVFLLALGPSLALAADKFPKTWREGQFSQVAFIDLPTISRGYFQSQLRVRFTQKFRSPDSVTPYVDQSTDDLGNEHKTTLAVIEGSPIIDQLFEADEIDDSGNVKRKLHSQKFAQKSITTLPAQKYDFFSAPLLKLSARLGSESFTFTDASGKRALITLDVALQPAFYLEPEKRDIVQIADPGIEMRISAAFLEGERTFSTGPVFGAHEQAVPESAAKFAHCRKRGEATEISPLVFGPELQSERVEYCYPVGREGYERMVLIRKNPPHEPKENAVRTLEAAAKQGGRISTRPLFALEQPSYANCHGYALLATLGEKALPTDAYWIQAQALTTYTLGTQPLDILLRENFQQIFSVGPSYYDDRAEKKLALDSRLREGDLLVFSGGGGMAHSAVVRRSPDGKALWLENKFEEGPIIHMPIASVHDIIPNLYHEILVYRKK